MFKETKARSMIKGLIWRVFAFLNSWSVSWLVLGVMHASSFFISALAMNITGLIVFYIYERVWNRINKGRYIDGEMH